MSETTETRAGQAISKDDPAVVLMQPRLETEARTYVVFGVPRGGTTMIAGLARMCGLDIGDNLPKNCEDPAFNLDILLKSMSREEAIAAMAATIAQRNAGRTVWGWKFPAAGRYLQGLQASLRDPHLICVFRDPAATFTRNVRRGVDPFSALKRAEEMQRRNVNILSEWQVPSLVVSYEKAVKRPEATVEAMAAFLGRPQPADMRAVVEYMQPGDYKPVPGAA